MSSILLINLSNHFVLSMDNKNQSRNIDPQKIRAENLNGKFALVGLIALVGAYITTGQIVPGII